MKSHTPWGYILTHYICAVIMTLIIMAIALLSLFVPVLGYLYMFLILGGLIVFCFLTNIFRTWIAVTGFLLNFAFWTLEQVSLERTFHSTPLYTSEKYNVLVLLLGAVLWATNKLIIDWLFLLFGAKEIHPMRGPLYVKGKRESETRQVI